MELADALGAVNMTLTMMVKLSMPLLLISMMVGLIISVFQAATQIHEQTLTFVPKLVVIVIILLVAGNWMVVNLQDFASDIFALMLEG